MSPAAGGAIGSDSLLDLLEPRWRSQLAAGMLPAALDVDDELARAVAGALGEQARLLPDGQVAGRWPACLVVGLVRVRAGERDFWQAWHAMARARMTWQSADRWGRAFCRALGTLGIAPPGMPQSAPRTAVQDYLAAVSAASAAAGTDEDGDRHSGMPLVPGERGPRTRLDPFGAGVLLAGEPSRDGAGAGDRPALPGEAADPGEPLLVFDEDGQPAGPVLPSDIVWALYPADRELRSDIPPRVVLTVRPPLTWRAWRQVQLDLRGSSWLGLAGGQRRTVRGRASPALRTGFPVPGVTAGGRPVYAAPPDVLLPPGPGRWRVEARRAGSRAVLASVTSSGESWQPEALWQRAPRPLLGELTITVRAEQSASAAEPGLRRAIVIAEGLAIGAHPALRLTTARGLEPGEVVIGTPAGMTASPAALSFAEMMVTQEVTTVAGTVVQRLAVTPPHIRVRVDPEPGSGEAPAPWHWEGPLRLAPGDLWRGGALRLDLPGVADLPAVLVVPRDAGAREVTGRHERGTRPGRLPQPDRVPAQVLEPTGQGLYPVRRILDTTAAHGDLELVITVAARNATIATVAGPALAAGPWALA